MVLEHNAGFDGGHRPNATADRHASGKIHHQFTLWLSDLLDIAKKFVIHVTGFGDI